MRRALLLPLLVVFLAGCGGGGDDGGTSKEDFKKQFAPVDSELKAEGRSVAAQFQSAEGQSDAALATAFDKIAMRLHASIAKLEDIEPTDELKADYAELQKQFKQVHKDIAGIASAARAHD